MHIPIYGLVEKGISMRYKYKIIKDDVDIKNEHCAQQNIYYHTPIKFKNCLTVASE